MSQQVDSNIMYIDTQLDKDGVFVITRLNPLVEDTSSIPGLSGLEIDGNTSIKGYSKTVGSIDGFNTRITQNEMEISSVAADTSGNTAQLTIQAAQISAVVVDAANNTTLIAQNATDITLESTSRVNGDAALQASIGVNSSAISLEVSDRTNADSVLQSSITINSQNIALKVSSDDIINSINISGEGIRIDASRLEINGSTIFSNGYDPTDIQDNVDDVQDNLDDLENNLGDFVYENSIEEAMEEETLIVGGYINTSYIQTDNLDVSGTFTAGTSTEYVKIHRPSSGDYANVPVIEFADGNEIGGVIYYDDDILSDSLVIKAEGYTLQSRLVLSAGGDLNNVSVTLDSWNDKVSFDCDIDMNGNDLDDVDNAYVDDLYVTDIYAQANYIYVKDPMIFAGTNTTLSIPTTSSSNPAYETTGTFCYNYVTKKLGVYDGGWIWTDALT